MVLGFEHGPTDLFDTVSAQTFILSLEGEMVTKLS